MGRKYPGQPTPTCRWIKRAATPDSPGEYCGKKVEYTIETCPETGERYREYCNFCPEHRARGEAEARRVFEEGDDD